MSRMKMGSACGIVFGILSISTMIPYTVEDKAAVMLGTFVSRFAIGLVIGTTNLPVPGWLQGIIFGLLLSLPTAILTETYIPVIGLGLLGGFIIGILVNTREDSTAMFQDAAADEAAQEEQPV